MVTLLQRKINSLDSYTYMSTRVGVMGKLRRIFGSIGNQDILMKGCRKVIANIASRRLWHVNIYQ